MVPTSNFGLTAGFLRLRTSKYILPVHQTAAVELVSDLIDPISKPWKVEEIKGIVPRDIADKS